MDGMAPPDGTVPVCVPHKYTGSSKITTGIALNDIPASHPSTRLTVQHWLDDDDERASDDDYKGITCTACSRVHFVNRKGRVLGDDED